MNRGRPVALTVRRATSLTASQPAAASSDSPSKVKPASGARRETTAEITTSTAITWAATESLGESTPRRASSRRSPKMVSTR